MTNIHLAFHSASVGHVAYGFAVTDGNTANGIDADERTTVGSLVVVRTLQQHALCTEVSHAHIHPYGCVKIGEHGAALSSILVIHGAMDVCLVFLMICCSLDVAYLCRMSEHTFEHCLVCQIGVHILVASSAHGEYHHIAGFKLHLAQSCNGVRTL